MSEEDTCEYCVFYEPKGNKCWEDPANPKTVTQPDAKCERKAEKQ